MKIKLTKVKIGENGFHYLLKAKLNDKKIQLVIDTGASQSVFDHKRITALVDAKKDIKTMKEQSTGLGTSSMQSYSVKTKTLQIKNLVLKNYKAILLDLSHANVTYEQIGLKGIDGILGNDILTKYKAVIDLEKRVLKLTI